MNLFLLLLGMESLCALLTESFHLIVPVQAYLWLALLCLFLWIAANFRYGILIGFPLSALTLLLLYREYSQDLMKEFQDLMGHISAAYYGNYSTSGSLNGFEAVSDSHMTSLLILLFLLAAFTAISLSAGSFRILLAELASLPVAAACIAINGTPSIYPVLGLLLYWIGLTISGDVFHLNDAAWKQFGVGLIITLSLMAVLLLFFGPKHYEYTEKDIHLSQQFDRLGEFLSEWLSDNNHSTFSIPHPEAPPEKDNTPQEQETEENASAGQEALRGWSTPDGTLDLTVPFDSAGLDRTLFRLNANLSGALYLRGRSYGDYAGTKWLAPAENTHASALSYTAQAVFRGSSHSDYHFQLSGNTVYDVLYLPYYSVSDVLSDTAVSSEGRNSYGGEFYMPTASSGYGSLPDSLLDEELQYREFAHNYYTRLPDVTKATLLNLCAEHNLSSERSDILAAVAQYVRSIGEYDINTAPYPDDDYAVYFLTTAQRGYCVHYATAAAALYRSLGIPARLCEGYLVYAQNGRSISVTGMNAHAWVEVYMDGVGWLPVEVTTSGTGDSVSSQTDNAPPESTSPTEEQPPQDVSPAEITMTPDVEPAPVASDGAESGQTAAGEEAHPVQQLILTPEPEPTVSRIIQKAFLHVLTAFLLLAALLFGRYALLRAVLHKRLHAESGRQLVINLYLQAERVLRFGGKMPEEIRIPAEKASFSPHELSEEETADASAALQRLTDTVWKSLTLRKKFIFRFLMGNK